MPFFHLDGKIQKELKNQISPNDLAVLRGFAVYEGIKLYGGRPFMVADHYRRMQKSARAIGIRLPVSLKQFTRAITDLAKKLRLPNGIVRVLVTGGETDGINYLGKPRFLVMVLPHHPLPEKLYTDGASLILHEYLRYMPEHKTTFYIEAVMLQGKRTKANAIEILYHHRGMALECATSNIAAVIRGRLVMPKKDVLPGVTLKVTRAVMQRHLPIVERDISLKELFTADEVFITSSFKDIVPIVKIGSKRIGNGKVGRVTKEAMTRFAEFVDSGRW